ncbi:hypothetical protein [Gimibacter soli]|uniref:Uncharacterized protein n=1 Tax=Gimibacter soli TaxID=3024400 RepID=A0AAE9XU34_9PROT|nr:hypothetical protein [Gimibacter soli]WCL53493.1 hypothetical protein PH603_13190 [Gimibacter soli]
MIEDFDFFVSEICEGPLASYPLGSCAFIYGNFEERSNHFSTQDRAFSKVSFFEVIEEVNETLNISGVTSFPKSNIGAMRNFILGIEKDRIFLDVTGLCHSVWAPLLKVSLSLRKKISIIYVEPKDYKKSDNPAAGLLYDLSEKTRGIAPIPGFASFSGDDDERYIFAAFVGFEGPRLFHALEQLEPERDTVFPIIGVPGYKPEYPFYSFEGNVIPLMHSKYQAWKNIRYASASCPFSAYRCLVELLKEFPQRKIKVGLFGTKPHALGAILFRLNYPDIVELIYDHPVRKIKRTSGAMIKHIFDISDFMENLPAYQETLTRGRLR